MRAGTLRFCGAPDFANAAIFAAGHRRTSGAHQLTSRSLPTGTCAPDLASQRSLQKDQPTSGDSQLWVSTLSYGYLRSWYLFEVFSARFLVATPLESKREGLALRQPHLLSYFDGGGCSIV